MTDMADKQPQTISCREKHLLSLGASHQNSQIIASLKDRILWSPVTGSSFKTLIVSLLKS